MYDLICNDASGNCKFAQFIPAYRSHSRNLPDSCWGTIMPGDEAHVDCEFGGECDHRYCPILHGEAVDENAWECYKEEEEE